jgi:hypothetical protein
VQVLPDETTLSGDSFDKLDEVQKVRAAVRWLKMSPSAN